MSLRWEWYYADLAALEGLWRSSDSVIIDSARSTISKLGGDAEFQRACAAVIERAVRQGVPFPDLEVENGVHVACAHALILSSQSLREVAFTADWKHGAWFTFYEEFSERLDERAATHLTHVVHGRPIFGRRIETGWEHYAFLSNHESRELRQAIATAWALYPDSDRADSWANY